VRNCTTLIVAQDMTSPLDRRVWLEATSLQKQGFRVIILCPNSKLFPNFIDNIDGIKIFRYPQVIEGKSTWRIFLEYVFSTILIFFYELLIGLRFRIDILHLCNPPDFLFQASIGLRVLRKPKIIWDQHDVVPELWLAKGKSKTSIFFKSLCYFEKNIVKKCDLVIFASEGFERRMISNGIQIKDKSVVVKTSPRKNFGRGQLSDPFRSAKSDKTTFRIVYLGRMGSQDGIDLLIEAFSIVLLNNSNLLVELNLIGDGPERRNLEKRSQVLGTSLNTKFLGYVFDEEELCDLLSRSDIAVCPDLPNVMNEISSMNKITEYLAIGLPIVQFNLEENVKTSQGCSIIAHENNSRSLAEAISTLVSDPKLRNELSQRARARFLRELSWEMQELKLVAAYQRLL